MSRFQAWYLAEQLRSMGWPRSKGFLNRKSVVDTRLVDVVIGGAIQMCMGLGAGRPQLGVSLLADTFRNDPWTKESTAELLVALCESDGDIEASPEVAPWKILSPDTKLASFGDEMPWTDLGDPRLMGILGGVTAKGLYWGLTHEKEISHVFARDKESYESSSGEAISYGLEITAEYPWESLEVFYEICEELVQLYQSVRQPLAEIPDELRKSPEVARRLRD